MPRSRRLDAYPAQMFQLADALHNRPGLGLELRLSSWDAAKKLRREIYAFVNALEHATARKPSGEDQDEHARVKKLAKAIRSHVMEVEGATLRFTPREQTLIAQELASALGAADTRPLHATLGLEPVQAGAQPLPSPLPTAPSAPGPDLSAGLYDSVFNTPTEES